MAVYGISSAPGELLGDRVFASEKPGDGTVAGRAPWLVFATSQDAIDWRKQQMRVERYPSGEDNYDLLVPVKYSLKPVAGAKYLRAKFTGTAETVRVKLDCRP